MGFFFSMFSKSESTTPPPPPPPAPVVTSNDEVKKLTQEFQAKYPEIMTAFNNLSAQEDISDTDKTTIKSKYANELNKVPVTTVDKLYTFMVSLIKQYSINVTPTDEQVQKLLEDFSSKYPGLEQYLSPVKSLSDEEQADANMEINIFLSTYPLGTVDEFYNISISILKKYDLPIPTIEQAQKNTRDASGNVTGFEDYGKISMKMDPILKNRSLVEESYSSFSR
jgi:hypothetical protein